MHVNSKPKARVLDHKGFSLFSLGLAPWLGGVMDLGVIVTDSIHVALLYDWRESCLLIGPICLHKSQRLPENRSKLVYTLILQDTSSN